MSGPELAFERHTGRWAVGVHRSSCRRRVVCAADVVDRQLDSHDFTSLGHVTFADSTSTSQPYLLNRAARPSALRCEKYCRWRGQVNSSGSPSALVKRL